jgi:hypothetical protein
VNSISPASPDHQKGSTKMVGHETLMQNHKKWSPNQTSNQLIYSGKKICNQVNKKSISDSVKVKKLSVGSHLPVVYKEMENERKLRVIVHWLTNQRKKIMVHVNDEIWPENKYTIYKTNIR